MSTPSQPSALELSPLEKEILSDPAIQAEYAERFAEQLKRLDCPACGDGAFPSPAERQRD